MLAFMSVPACASSSTTTAATSAGGMQMGSRQPENDAAAAAALQAHSITAAKHDLRAAIASRYEPRAAKRYARDALMLVGQRKDVQAEKPAMRGAAVEHLSWALAALKAHDPTTATGHLMEAAALPPSSRAAKAAIAAIKANHIARAVTLVTSALRALSG
jgi:hypothetical protein